MLKVSRREVDGKTALLGGLRGPTQSAPTV
jgi:hypothetical protein